MVKVIVIILGDGKTHAIHRSLMPMDEPDKCVIISVDESFSALKTIMKLRKLYHGDGEKQIKVVDIHFNFTLSILKVRILVILVHY